MLAFFKYQHFFLPELARLGLESDGLRLLVPIGLSFYIVQAIAYLMDLDKGLQEPERDPLDFALFMIYFPRMISGPIERARDFLPKLKAPRLVDDELFARSLTLILMGLFRKLAVADVLNVILPKDVFSDPSHYRAPELALWLLAYSFILYNDFAGYSSIVRGVSGLFGIELNQNFNLPYLARNMVEFWARWHMSLSEWLRDYSFTPTTRALLRRKYNSRHPLTMVVPPLLTMFHQRAIRHDVQLEYAFMGRLAWRLPNFGTATRDLVAQPTTPSAPLVPAGGGDVARLSTGELGLGTLPYRFKHHGGLLDGLGPLQRMGMGNGRVIHASAWDSPRLGAGGHWLGYAPLSARRIHLYPLASH